MPSFRPSRDSFLPGIICQARQSARASSRQIKRRMRSEFISPQLASLVQELSRMHELRRFDFTPPDSITAWVNALFEELHDSEVVEVALTPGARAAIVEC